MPADIRVLLVGNYRLDGQMSMLRYFEMLHRELPTSGIDVSSIEPRAYFGKIAAGSLTKWLRYVDKYLIFPSVLNHRIKKLLQSSPGKKIILHVTDHSNALYLTIPKNVSTVVTCHDLLAVRGALGEDTDCPASGLGKILQSRILGGLGAADHVVCVSQATRDDLTKLAPSAKSSVIPLPLNQAYGTLTKDEIRTRLEAEFSFLLTTSYVLHVGSSLKRKNREGVLRIFAKIADRFPGMLVFAGEKLTPGQRALADQLGIASRVVEIVQPSGKIIEALYNRAHALLFPSRTEGFGWPIIEAQACGCPVLVARTTSLPEVMGKGGFIRDLRDEGGFAEDLLSLNEQERRTELIELGFANLARFDTDQIIQRYVACYQSV